MRTISLEWQRIDWEQALQELRLRYPRLAGQPAHRYLVESLSLSSLFERSYGAGAARLREAQRLAPLNPLHALRGALHEMRFGRWTEALEGAQALSTALRDQPLPLYVCALANLRCGQVARANNLASELVEFHPQFVPGRFLKVEGQSRIKLKGLDQALMALPSDAALAPLWCDLLCKFVLDGASRAARLAEEYLDRLPPGSREEALVRTLLEWQRALSQAGGPRAADKPTGGKVPAAADSSLEVFEQRLLNCPPGSRAEQAQLVLFHDLLRATQTEGEVLHALREFHARVPERAAVRRLYVATLTQRAVDDVAKNRLEDALSVVEVCLRLEPHEILHRLNRAALFTLLREEDAYHDAWADVDRLHFRMALLGRTDPESAREMLKPHRMFAQQARLTPGESNKVGMALGVFREEVHEGEKEPILVVNQERLERDPEQLRQWIHHRRAEMTFAHLALGSDPNRFLLQPSDSKVAIARAEGLALAARSLTVLVPEEGQQLCERLAQHWKALATQVVTRYGAPQLAEDVQALQRAHLDNFADLALLCFRWTPSGLRPELVEEVLDFLRAEAPFFDEQVLYSALESREPAPSITHKVLRMFVREVVGELDDEKRPTLSDEQRRQVMERLSGRLLMALSLRTHVDAGGGVRDGLDRALEFIDRARQAIPDEPTVEFRAAWMLTEGGYYEEARAAVARYHKLARGRDQPPPEALDQIQKILDKAQKDNREGRKRSGVSVETVAEHHAQGIDELERHVERFPAAIQGYEELTRALAKEGLFDKAVAWAERAMARCLSRTGQLRARALHLEIAALQHVAYERPQEVRLYLAGTHGPLLEVLAAWRGTPSYGLDYLRGLCLIAARQGAEAQQAFMKALSGCTRQLHLSVLRPLAEGVQPILLDRARRAIDDALQDGRIEEAAQVAEETLSELSAPEAFLLDLARLQLSAVVANVSAPPLPRLSANVPWASRLVEAASPPAPLERCRRLIALSRELHLSTGKEAEALLRKVEVFEAQLATAKAFAESGRLFRERKWGEALSVLEQLGEAGQLEPRILQQRIMLLLKLERFDEADALFERLAAGNEPIGAELAERYPSLSFQHRMAAISRLLRAGDGEAAARLLAGTRATGEPEELELSYCRAFALAREAYRLHEGGELIPAARKLTEALEVIEGRMPGARRHGHTRLIELHARLDKELADLEARS